MKNGGSGLCVIGGGVRPAGVPTPGAALALPVGRGQCGLGLARDRAPGEKAPAGRRLLWPSADVGTAWKAQGWSWLGCQDARPELRGEDSGSRLGCGTRFSGCRRCGLLHKHLLEHRKIARHLKSEVGKEGSEEPANMNEGRNGNNAARTQGTAPTENARVCRCQCRTINMNNGDRSMWHSPENKHPPPPPPTYSGSLRQHAAACCGTAGGGILALFLGQ